MKKLKIFILSLMLIGCSSQKEIVEPPPDMSHMPITIESIEDNIITGINPYPTPYQYIITYTGKNNLKKDYCVGDIIEVYYEEEPKLREDQPIQITTDFISKSDFKLEPGVCYKPVIYLYPKKEMNIHVSLDYNGTLTYTYPKYNQGWDVVAYPDGTIFYDQKEYPYLIWEGIPDYKFNLSKGFCISHDESETFLDEKLSYLGLNQQEIKDFKLFWLPTLKQNPYNIISFQEECYQENAKLNINPLPDTIIRVFMTIQPSSHFVDIPTQVLTPLKRHGYSVIEWGGTILE